MILKKKVEPKEKPPPKKRGRKPKGWKIIKKEVNDLASDYPEIVIKMENLLKEAHTTANIDKFKIPALEN